MCGRFTLRTPAAEWAQQFLPDLHPDQILLEEQPRYNIAPTQLVACVLRDAIGSSGSIQGLKWGLIPPWAKDRSIGSRMINARGETVDSKPSFRGPFKSRRCLIPADGYYEWKKVDGGKQPYLIEPTGRGVLAMAGLWEENRKLTEDDTAIRTCTIITTASNDSMSRLHHRMPVLLEPADYERWLDPSYQDIDQLKQLLTPAAEDALKLTEVSRRVNSPKYDDAQCIAPLNAS